MVKQGLYKSYIHGLFVVINQNLGEFKSGDLKSPLKTR